MQHVFSEHATESPQEVVNGTFWAEWKIGGGFRLRCVFFNICYLTFVCLLFDIFTNL